MNKIEEIYQTNVMLLNQLKLDYKEWRHEPILDFATDERVARALGWTGIQSKSLFLALKGGGYALYLTEKNARLNTKAIKQVLGKRPSICTNEDMTEQLGCLPGAVCPFGMPKHITIIVDKTLFEQREILYTPGDPKATIALSGSALKTVLSVLPNTVIAI
ncbi:YbaK/EbsC family protein [Vibrio ostreicida]|uniref:YbaK/EbsC family protein n=1 Tax=Vibrio ostreicida TaxID=526588 RepID=A0ABT8BQ14_9VIBR|nr:YbaK/EbsC family protein [Vibrio ostreicida]MDN3608986.1 YbaK/EbsC family protein [Vibrio ostreicida]NPD07886.1 YbaK/EbsC family protein [Vibrio ostreicida]